MKQIHYPIKVIQLAMITTMQKMTSVIHAQVNDQFTKNILPITYKYIKKMLANMRDSQFIQYTEKPSKNH